MAIYVEKTNSGIAFYQEGKREVISGQCNIEGTQYSVRCYENISKKNGSKYIGLTFYPLNIDKDGSQSSSTSYPHPSPKTANNPTEAPKNTIPEDDLPF